jgi:TrmH family RNA methyltransferase
MSERGTVRRASHPLARLVRRLASSAQARHDEGMFLAEGPRVLAAALSAGVRLSTVLVAAEGVPERAKQIVDRAHEHGAEIVPVSTSLLQRLAPSASGQGLIGIGALPERAGDPERVLALGGAARILMTWQVQDPGNLGTLIRSTAALGGRGVLAVGGADPWGPKAVRSSAGAVFHLPVARWSGASPVEVAARLEAAGFRRVTAAAHGGGDPEEIDWSRRTALVLGAEVAGLPPALVDGSLTVTIPIDAPSESLSVAAAGAVLLDRARRGRAREAVP